MAREMYTSCRTQSQIRKDEIIETSLVVAFKWKHFSVIASQITSLAIVYSTVYSGADQRKHQNSALLALWEGNSPVNSPPKGPVTRSFDVFCDLRLNKRLSKQSRGWWFETLSRSLWRHSSATSPPPPSTLAQKCRNESCILPSRNNYIFEETVMVVAIFSNNK